MTSDAVQAVATFLKRLEETEIQENPPKGFYISGSLEVWSADDYVVGVISTQEDWWVFEPADHRVDVPHVHPHVHGTDSDHKTVPRWVRDELSALLLRRFQRTVSIVGTRDAQAIVDKLTEALDAAGVEVPNGEE